jgi:hypothetical protein
MAKDEFDCGWAGRSRRGPTRTWPQSPLTSCRLQPAAGARQESANKKRKAVAALACATAAIVGMLAAPPPPIPDGSPLEVRVIVLIFVLFGAVSTGWLLLFHAWLDERAGRKAAQGLPPGGGGEASRSLAPADPAGQLPPVNPGQQQTADAAPSRSPRTPLSSWRPPHRWHPLGRRYAIGYPGH